MSSKFTLMALLRLGTVSLGGKPPNGVHYEPEMVRLTGTIVARTFPGPPDYESLNQGDTPETYWVLKPKGPIDVAAAADDEMNVAEKNVRELQLVFTGHSSKGYRD